ncbi:MAG: permease prefix domain 1-containing protein [Burkholderiales bacterium]
MTLLQRLVSILRGVFHRNRSEQDLNDEMGAFVDMAAADKIREGAAADEARRLAVIQLGGVERAKERVPDRSLRRVARRNRAGRALRRATAASKASLVHDGHSCADAWDGRHDGGLQSARRVAHERSSGSEAP